MAHLLFFVAMIAGCLFWAAASIALAVRTERPWLRRLLVAAGVLLAPLALLPAVGVTAYVAFGLGWPTNWFAPTLTAFLSMAIGGWWIYRAGLSRPASGTGFVANAWPVFGLVAMALAADVTTYGTLVSIDHDALARARSLRAEAAELIAASTPPAPAADDDAAPLYQRASAAIEADKAVSGEKSPLADPLTADVAAENVSEILARHAATLQLVRRAADKPGCRFIRDWSRPSPDMLLPEFSSMRKGGKLLALDARREAASGKMAAALRDVVRIHRLGMHAASEPVLIAGLVGQAIDQTAIETLAAVLPAIGKQDLPLLDDPAFTDFLGTPVSYQRHFYGEEAFGISTIALLAENSRGLFELTQVAGPLASQNAGTLARLVGFSYRCFWLPAELAGYREALEQYRTIAGDRTQPFPPIKERITGIERDAERGKAGMFGKLMLPALGQVLVTEIKGRVFHRAAEVLVAATRFRLANGSLPESATALVPDYLPAVPLDPFTTDAPLRTKRADDGWLIVYSVGPDGEDDGGPPPRGTQRPQENDDIGLRMKQ
jgi:hypothetical protein